MSNKDGMSVEDLSLPRTMIQRLAKGVLPPNTQIQKDALLALSKSATVFVNYLSSYANENTMRANKKTIQPQDVLDAIQELEFDGFLPRLEGELQKYSTLQNDKRNTYRRKVREEKSAAAAAGSAAEETAASASTPSKGKRPDSDSPPAAKKQRRSSAGPDEATDGDEDSAEQVDIDEAEVEQDEGEDQDEDDDETEEEDDDDQEGKEEGEDTNLEDPIEERESDEQDDDEALDGNESD